ncbi:CLUMA_CG016245, isoform A [Clunio marinus]|uniref:CLUMA_CG016245, isoform A n=1 Tax=Clunio marinus TaxID=568069 RepID=A0A1J1IXW4_9DIPT|nr:CLUMA_CG016245, isoform A [Clunio marinus]
MTKIFYKTNMLIRIFQQLTSHPNQFLTFTLILLLLNILKTLDGFFFVIIIYTEE